MHKKKEIIEHSTGNMVTIDDLLKGDPKALEELKGIRKFMDDNPHIFDFPKAKVTQGQQKMRQLLEDARRNSRFTKKLAELAGAKPTHSVFELQNLYSLYRMFFSALHEFRKQYLLNNKYYRLRKYLCREYGIEPSLLEALIHSFRDNRLEGWDFNEETSGDMCALEVKSENDKPIDIHSFHLTVVDQIESAIYPIGINIHRFASKRDVLDYIEKKWDEISLHLKERRIKERKLPREVTDFIWKHKNEKTKKIMELLRDKFPKISLAYYEINKIIYEEKKRRGGNK